MRPSFLGALPLLALAVACSSSSPSASDAGTHHDAVAPAPKVDAGTRHDAVAPAKDAGSTIDAAPSGPLSLYFTSTLGSTAGDAGSPDAGTACTVDSPNAPFVTVGSTNAPVTTGATFGGNVITGDCTVHPTGTGTFQVKLDLTDGEIATISVQGTVKDIATPQGSITVSFEDAAVGDYQATDCTLTLSTEETPAIAAGRVSGAVSCPTINGVGTPNICAATATFVFENCTE